MTRLVLLATSPRVAAGLLSSEAWLALRAGPVFAADVDSALATALSAAGLTVTTVPAVPDEASESVARDLIAAARHAGTATWLLGADGDQRLVRALAATNAELSDTDTDTDAGDAIEIEPMHGSWDLPGARLLDVVTTMDRLRSAGGCPWDAQQDHTSLAPYLLEEAYEAFQAIEDADSAALCEELGDVLLQVAFHARLAAEHPDGERWSIDDVADGLVAKLIRRHPHVFDGAVVDGAAEVTANWESIKAAERGGASVVANVALAAPALTLAATLQRKTARAGIDVSDALPEIGVVSAAASFDGSPSAESAGALLWAAVAAMRVLDIDAESALRARAREFRDEVDAAAAARSAGDA